MATARIYMIFCVRHSSGTDSGVIEAIANLTDTLVGSEFGVPLQDAVAALPAVIAAIDTAQDDPDNLFMTFGSDQVENAFWPAPGEYTNVYASQSRQILLDFNVDYSQSVSLWDHDGPSSNDHLGSVTIFANEAGEGEKAKIAKNPVEGSAYYVIYEVFA